MEIVNDGLEWNSDNVLALKTFLQTQAGMRLIPKLAELSPTLFAGGDTNQILIRNGELLGYQAALRNLISLANPPPEPAKQTDPYPPLNDDKAWAGTEGAAGQKIE